MNNFVCSQWDFAVKIIIINQTGLDSSIFLILLQFFAQIYNIILV